MISHRINATHRREDNKSRHGYTVDEVSLRIKPHEQHIIGLHKRRRCASMVTIQSFAGLFHKLHTDTELKEHHKMKYSTDKRVGKFFLSGCSYCSNLTSILRPSKQNLALFSPPNKRVILHNDHKRRTSTSEKWLALSRYENETPHIISTS